MDDYGKYLWNIGTEEDPIIQGQAGKPFYHELGGCIRLSYNSVPVPNGSSDSAEAPLYIIQGRDASIYAIDVEASGVVL